MKILIRASRRIKKSLINTFQCYSFLEMAEKFLAHIEQTDITEGSFTTLEVRYKAVKKYLESINDIDRLPEDINPKFAKGLEIYYNQYSKAYVNKILHFCKRVNKFCIQEEILNRNPLEAFEFSKIPPQQVKFLTEDELELLKEQNIKSGKLSRVRDIFVFCAYTGMAYNEYMRFAGNPKYYISTDIEGNRWIEIDRQKAMGSFCYVPVFETAERLLKDYKYKLPRISNQSYNEYLKEVACEVGIEKHLTTHIARKTFACLMLNHDVPIVSIAEMLGHRTIEITQKIYAQINRSKLDKDTRDLRAIF